MEETKTIHYLTPCGHGTIHITVGTKYLHFDTKKAGSCDKCQLAVIAQLAEMIPKDEVIKVFMGQVCKHALAGRKSCYDAIAHLYRGTATVDEKGVYRLVEHKAEDK